MSHYARNPKTYGRKLVYKQSTQKIRPCWVCGVDLLTTRNGISTRKVCAECHETKTDEEIKQAYAKMYRNRREQFYAKKQIIKPCDEKFIFNSPFRKPVEKSLKNNTKSIDKHEEQA